jgi:hypothetical protein
MNHGGQGPVPVLRQTVRVAASLGGRSEGETLGETVSPSSRRGERRHRKPILRWNGPAQTYSPVVVVLLVSDLVSVPAGPSMMEWLCVLEPRGAADGAEICPRGRGGSSLQLPGSSQRYDRLSWTPLNTFTWLRLFGSSRKSTMETT